MKTKLTLLFFLGSACLLDAQIWTEKKDGYYGLLSFSTSSYANAYDSTGELVSLYPFKIENLIMEFAAQYGITDHITVSLKIPYSIQASVFEGDDLSLDPFYVYQQGNLSYFGNIEAGIIYKLRDEKPFISGSFFIGTGTNDHNYITSLASGFDAWNFKPGIGIGWKLNKFWYQGYVAADVKSNEFSSGILSSLEAGYKPIDEFYVALAYSGRITFDNGDYCNCALIPTGLFFNNQQYAIYTIRPGFYFNGLGLNFGYSAPLYAANAPGEGVFTVGFSYKKQ